MTCARRNPDGEKFYADWIWNMSDDFMRREIALVGEPNGPTEWQAEQFRIELADRTDAEREYAADVAAGRIVFMTEKQLQVWRKAVKGTVL